MFLKIILAIIFGLAIIGKLTGKTKDTFDKAGYGSWAMYGIALAEFIFTIELFSKFDLLATVGLLVIIGGAIITLNRQRVKLSNYLMVFIAAVLLIVLLYFLVS